MDSRALEGLFDWLVDGAPGGPNPVALLDRLLPGLAGAGVPIVRAEAFVRTLHPHIVGRSFFWEKGSPVKVRENSFAYLNSAEFLESPVGEVFKTGAPVRKPGFAAFPLKFTNGQVHAITFATEGGDFAAEHIAALERIVRPLSRLAEIFALARTAANLLSTYVGRGAGDRILSGQIRRGDTETIRCAIWFSDLRGFTPMSESKEPGEIIRVLNDLFECQVPAIERHGGEVLKFMGDGLLGIFPVGAREPREACEAALRAYEDASAALERHNRTRGANLRFGLALHLGEVAYGNIGGSARLDFTCIGPAVNLASRLEGLTAKVERPLLMSSAFAACVTRPVREVGRFALKGMSEPQPAFEPG